MRNLFNTLKIFKSNFQWVFQNVVFMYSLKLYDSRRQFSDRVVFFSNDWDELKVGVINWRDEFQLGFEHIILSVFNKVALLEFSFRSMVEFEIRLDLRLLFVV